MRARLAASLVVVLSCATPALAFGECREPLDARAVVEYARKKGYQFELTLASSEGTCWVDSSGYLLIASATSTGDVVCNGRIFSKIVSLDGPSVSAGVPASPALPVASSAATPVTAAGAWTIVWIRIATPDGGSIFPTEETSENRRGWAFQVIAPRGNTLQYLIDTVQFKTQEECRQWQNAF